MFEKSCKREGGGGGGAGGCLLVEPALNCKLFNPAAGSVIWHDIFPSHTSSFLEKRIKLSCTCDQQLLNLRRS